MSIRRGLQKANPKMTMTQPTRGDASASPMALGRYPVAPGFKEVGGTSEAAASSISSRSAILRAGVLRTLRQTGNLTADETAGFMGESVLSIRPRFSELLGLGLIAKTGERRPNEGGHNAIVWKLSETGNRA
ncbi:hypothetical protein [Methylobacterium sp. WCS2018Hpa-22]|uniref:hypothetical protein n=1 Tax=Methylobacterium sp. WCS2018Hpa-22 TaxID=3073633 RepID=UPI00288B0E00|nr:hypothetical protein [Methylobacterium sp. WCS2018Hpa-22]